LSTDKPEDPDQFRVPVRTELTVLPADEPGQKKIGWTVKEYMGFPIKTAPQGLTHEEAMNTGNWPEGFEPEIITEKDGIKEGDLILAPNLSGWTVARVETTSEGKFAGLSQDKGWIYFLEFGQDDRKCWVCGGSGNLKAIQRLELTK